MNIKIRIFLCFSFCFTLFSLLVLSEVAKVEAYGGGGGSYVFYPSSPGVTQAPSISSSVVSTPTISSPDNTSSVRLNSIQIPSSGQVLGRSTFRFTKYLDPGTWGSDVEELQKRLTEEGVYTGPVTGYFGTLTFAAVKALQIKNKIDPLGVVGPATRAFLNNTNTGFATSAPATTQVSSQVASKIISTPKIRFEESLYIGLKGDIVTRLQEKLKSEGVYDGPITGYFGTLTFKGVKNLQSKYGLAQVGVVGPKTREILNK